MNQTSILIIDDVEAIRTFSSLVLKRMGYQFVDTADSAEVALEKVKYVVFDLILLDINLPSMNGLELLKHLSTKSPNSKVVMCSGSSSDDNIRQAIEDGAEGFLVKPVTPVNLVSLLHRLGFE
ncbi:MAG: two-component system chemotaxis response regulator CheY [Bermanella sp.]|jgi:two-component system chemotaxis response regulator CheY